MVECLECGVQKKALGAHVSFAHKMSLANYRDKYRDPVTGEDPPVGWTVQMSANPSLRPATAATASANVEDSEDGDGQAETVSSRTREQLGTKESARFNNRYQTLFLQADEDPALESTVENIVLNEIYIDRYNEQINMLTKRMGKANTKPTDITTLNLLSKLVKDTQSTNLSLMQSLSITRDQKQKNKKVIESTPSRFVSAFETLGRNMTADQLRRLNAEMNDAASRIQRNLSELKHLVPEDAVIEEGSDDVIGEGVIV